MSYLIPDDSGSFWKHIGKQELEIGDIPLSVAQLEKSPADHFVAVCPESLAECAIHAEDAEALVEHRNGYVESIDDA